MKYNKGFIGIGIIMAIIVGVLAVGGGAYYMGTKNNTVPKSPEVNNYQPQVNQNSVSDTPVQNNTVVKPSSVTNTTATQTGSGCTSNTTPWIKVSSPNGGETYTLGQSVVFKWTSCNVGNVSGEIDGVSNTNNSYSLFGESSGGSINNGQQTITFGSNQIVPGTYKFKVSKFNTPSISDSSDNYFTINATTSACTSTTSPWIKVASPNGGEIYPLSTVQNFTWQTCNIPSTAHLTGELVGISNSDDSKSLFGEGNDQGLANDTGSLNDGQQSIDFGPIPSTGVQWINPGTYKFKLSLFNTPSVSDSSDNYFTIQ